jgi:hypothetical protein
MPAVLGAMFLCGVRLMSTAAFALAGLGGFNAHGAGFLAAASKCKVIPDLVTATSGQIVVLADWLQGKNLEQSLVVPELEHNTMAQLAIAVSGDPGVFRPAYPEALRRWLTPQFGGDFFEGPCNRLFPAQLYVPTRPASDFSTIADVFNNARIEDRDIGIVFNAYNLRTGQAVLYGNDKARGLWRPKRSNPDATKSVGDLNRTGADEIALEAITAAHACSIRRSLSKACFGARRCPWRHDRAVALGTPHARDNRALGAPGNNSCAARNIRRASLRWCIAVRAIVKVLLLSARKDRKDWTDSSFYQ